MRKIMGRKMVSKNNLLLKIKLRVMIKDRGKEIKVMIVVKPRRNLGSFVLF